MLDIQNHNHQMDASPEERMRALLEVISSYIEQYDADCANCLLVYKTGWPYSGEIFEVVSDRHICSTGKRTFETCIILQ